MLRGLLIFVLLPFAIFSAIGLFFRLELISWLADPFLDQCAVTPTAEGSGVYFWTIVSTAIWFGVVGAIPAAAVGLVLGIAPRSRNYTALLLVAFSVAAFGGLLYGYKVPEFYPHGWCQSDLIASDSNQAAHAFISFSMRQLLLYEVSFLTPVAALVAWWFVRPSDAGHR